MILIKPRRRILSTVYDTIKIYIYTYMDILGCPDSSAGEEFACNAGDPGSIPGSGRSPGEGIGYPLQCSWAPLVAQTVQNPPAMRETWVRSLGWKIPWRRAWQATPVFLPGETHGQSRLAGSSSWGRRVRHDRATKHSPADAYIMGFPGGSLVKNPTAKQETQGRSLGREDPLEKEMAAHSSIPAWEILWAE